MQNITKLVKELKLTKSIQKKKIQLEHTKPIFFNDMNLLSLHHLYIYHTFIYKLKLLKYKIPISVFELVVQFHDMSIYVYLYLGLNLI